MTTVPDSTSQLARLLLTSLVEIHRAVALDSRRSTVVDRGKPIEVIDKELRAQQAGQGVVGADSAGKVGPAGVRGLKIVDVPMAPVELEVDLDLFRKTAPLVKPKLVSLGLLMTLFPFPIKVMSEIVAEWGGNIFFDGAHQLGLVAGRQFQDPLREGTAVVTSSAGKTFSGPPKWHHRVE